ncbi:DUF342 domain-containing protein [Schinkia sp. CFF1]
MDMDKELMKLINSLFIEDKQRSKVLENQNEETTKRNPYEPLEDDGFIEVRDHQLFVKNPQNSGRTPVILYSKELCLLINGKKVYKDTTVSSKDVIEWSVNRHYRPFEIIVSKDKMKVFLKLSPEIATEYRLKDKKRSVRFKIEVVRIQKKFDIRNLFSTIIEKIHEKGILADIKMDVIYKELIHPTFEEILIAEGIPVIDSRDASLEVLFSEQKEEVLDDVGGRIDFRNRIKIPSVNIGDLIAILHSSIEGKPGMNVYGIKIHPNPPKQMTLRAKSNVKITDDGKVYALSKGRPTITGRTTKNIDILPTYEIRRDVDMKTGNIFFHGDVIVNGNVKENMRIESLGNVTIYGSVYSAAIISAQNIEVKGVVINSRLYAGSHGILYSQIYEVAQKLELDIKKVITAFNLIMNVISKKSQKIRKTYIFFLLVEQKFKSVMVEVKKMNKIISEIESLNISIPMQFNILKRMLYTIFDNKCSLMEDNLPNILDSLLFAIKEVTTLCENSIQEDSRIELGESDMSEIKTNGTITIRKSGVINSNIFAGKDCILQSEHAVVRGGRIYALRQIIGGIIGSEGGDCPHLIANERMYLRELHHGKITINHQTKIFEETLKSVEFSIEHSTKTMVYYSLGNKQAQINENNKTP